MRSSVVVNGVSLTRAQVEAALVELNAGPKYIDMAHTSDACRELTKAFGVEIEKDYSSKSGWHATPRIPGFFLGQSVVGNHAQKVTWELVNEGTPASPSQYLRCRLVEGVR